MGPQGSTPEMRATAAFEEELEDNYDHEMGCGLSHRCAGEDCTSLVSPHPSSSYSVALCKLSLGGRSIIIIMQSHMMNCTIVTGHTGSG